MPDGPPVRFSWRHVLHEVVHAEGPERIAMEWWRDAARQHAHARLFPRREQEGVRVWLYREGLFGRELEPPEKPRWYLHGLFA